ncbi:TonB-dependent siderophore receptor [Arcobacter defluvii]|uniref:TonB-dependent ferric coprogen/ferric-rhodotorulic acid receptor n=1 Tax=Arcobacter defluvii TaxID=873191 RepID=A0AAE7BHR2_9BACT|nr:TonB-dependent siderophore receptor [Arcobacter defluvii]QKF78104.1 TonB-dependent ferric coprogen/ferric-rhodotorulic acid receptor [Arcobacter defluvii]RXI33214.1 TonB-dependent siderophore receptor [Arcobacter defluvii]
MNLFKKRLLSPAVALLLYSSAMANDLTYSIEKQSLKDAIETISKKSNTPYIANSSFLDGKTSNAIKNIKGTKNALDKVLENSGLEAVIEDGAIIIKKKVVVGSGTVLEEVNINEGIYLPSGTTEGSGSYTTGSTNTATKLDLSLRDTPQSVKVLTEKYLEDANITSYQDMLKNITGVTVNRIDERVYPKARGFDVDYYLLDGMPTYAMANTRDYSANDPDMIMFDRVEIVKGANGLMTGSGNPGVGINMIRKHANSKEFTGNINISAGSWDDYSIKTDISTPLNDNGSIRARFVAKHQDSKSFLDFYEKTNDILYGVFDMDLTDTTYLSFGASYENIDRDGVRWAGIPSTYNDGSRTKFSRSTNVSGDWSDWDTKTKTYYTDLKQFVYKDISLNLFYSHRDMTTKSALAAYVGSVDKSSNLAADYSLSTFVGDVEEKEDNINFYVSIPFELANLKHEVVAGYIYNKYNLKKNNQKSDYKYTYAPGSGFDMFCQMGFLPCTQLDFNNINIANPNLSPTDKFRIFEREQSAKFLASKLSLMEELKIIAGVRVSDWEEKNTNGTDYKREFTDEVTPYIGVVYDIDDNHSIYTSYTNIFEPRTELDRDAKTLNPAEGDNYEAGIKGEYFDGKLNASLAFFRVEKDGVASDNDAPRLPDGSIPSKLVEGVVSKGVEFEMDGAITDNWALSFGISHFDAKEENGEKYKAESSRTTANLWSKYIFDRFELGAGLNYRSKIEETFMGNHVGQGGYTIVNTMFKYNIDKNMNLQLNIDNIFDKKYYEGIAQSNINYGEPRNFTLAMKYTF